ncbi:MAG: type II-A CRISPR-associated protein Csn2 [Muribaculum sp.]|nr:type II-A CRISPR-associated protein Csn2 [Muribaculum sp.]
MKLVWGAHNIALTFHENEILVFTVENPRTYTSLLQNFHWQCEGEDGELAISEKDMLISIENSVSIVWNPFLIDLNEKRIQNKLYQEMKKISDEEYCKEVGDICQCISRYLNDLSMKIPYAVSFNEGLDSVSIYKLCGVRLETEDDCLLQNLIEYIKVLGLLCNMKVVVFINLKAYFDEIGLMELYQTAFYYKRRVILIEDSQTHCLECEKHYILDLDDCLIEL